MGRKNGDIKSSGPIVPWIDLGANPIADSSARPRHNLTEYFLCIALAGLAFVSVGERSARATLTHEPLNESARLPQSPSSRYGDQPKQATATRAATAPRLDGLVDDDAWAAADVVTDFRQRTPVEGQPASERTEVSVLYDATNLYVGVIAYDSNPDAILATELRRDGLSVGEENTRRGDGVDDTFSVILDTFHDRRNAFLFAVNPLGTKYDAIISNEIDVNGEWDESWEAAARITERGWEAELRIPLAILRYNADASTWGLDFHRDIRRKNEFVAWSNYRTAYRLTAVSQSGALTGFESLTLSKRFRLKPYVIGTVNSLGAGGAQRTGDTEWGVEDLKIKLTSTLTADLTYNTDFAQVEVDEQRFNQTRFSLFFPEKREFFLEAANNYAFGQRRPRYPFSLYGPTVNLFFSRQIGLSEDGTPLPIEYGAKITGKVGRGNLGFLNVQTRETPLVAGKNSTAFRWRQELFGRSSIGALFTNVDGPDGTFNRVIGADADFTFLENLNFGGFIATASDDDIDGRRWTGEARAVWDNDLYHAGVSVLRIDKDFRSDLGFIQRDDIVRQHFTAGWRPRPTLPWLRQLVFDSSYESFDDSAGRLMTRRQWVYLEAHLESGESLTVSPEWDFERLDTPFRIHPDVTIPPGEYRFTWAYISLRSYAGRRVAGSLDFQVGGFFDGTRHQVGPRLNLAFSEKLRFTPSYSYSRFRFPSGNFDAHIVNTRVNYSFSDRWLADSLVQYNSIMQQVSIFARLRYIHRIGDDLYIVYRQVGAQEGMLYGQQDRTLTAKFTYSFTW